MLPAGAVIIPFLIFKNLAEFRSRRASVPALRLLCYGILQKIELGIIDESLRKLDVEGLVQFFLRENRAEINRVTDSDVFHSVFNLRSDVNHMRFKGGEQRNGNEGDADGGYSGKKFFTHEVY